MRIKAKAPAIITFAIAALVLGFFLTVQIKVFGGENYYESLTSAELTTIYSRLNLEVTELKTSYFELKDKYEQYSTISGSTEKLLRDVRNEIHALRTFTGQTAVEGKGVVIQIVDSDNNLETGDLIDLVNELRAAGAVAVAINNVRIVAQSGIKKADDGFIIDGHFVRSPYNVEALGNADTLFSAVSFPGGIADALKSIPKVSLTITKSERIIFPRAKRLEFKFGKATRL
jgi:uncharacterized protein YlxW (UPF0749 family)